MSMDFNHKPVLLKECIEYLDMKPDGVYVDGTMGGAGHSSEILKRLGTGGTLVGIDRDEYAVEVSGQRLEALKGQARLVIAKGNFRDMREICRRNGIMGADGILLDLGVSSHQLDEADRGFSYQNDAPLDMRMDRTQELDAGMIVNEYDEAGIKDIIGDFGEERWASRIAAFIVDARKKERIKTTGELVDIIKAAIPSAARREGPHPAKRTFQALRIAVNRELEALEEAVDEAVNLLNSGGRLCIITFHSLEDRIVKVKFAEKVKPCTCPADFPVCVCGKAPLAKQVTRKPMLPTEGEIMDNPRSRSAKLRVMEKI